MFPIDQIKEFIIGFIVRWVLKIGGAYFITIGIEQSTIEQIIGGLVAIVIGIIISLFQTKKALDKPVADN
ncbi:MAG: hypothetical protein IH620_01685 [Ignavibacterium sp.]|nr:hypothetical protein [Ignavibacterium sp.]